MDVDVFHMNIHGLSWAGTRAHFQREKPFDISAIGTIVRREPDARPNCSVEEGAEGLLRW